KLLAGAAIAAAALLPGALPAHAAPGAPAARSSLLCSVSYHSVKHTGSSGNVNGNAAAVSGTCLNLATLQTFPVPPVPFGPILGAGAIGCLTDAHVTMRIGTGAYFAYWTPTLVLPPYDVDLTAGTGNTPFVGTGSI